MSCESNPHTTCHLRRIDPPNGGRVCGPFGLSASEPNGGQEHRAASQASSARARVVDLSLSLIDQSGIDALIRFAANRRKPTPVRALAMVEIDNRKLEKE